MTVTSRPAIRAATVRPQASNLGRKSTVKPGGTTNVSLGPGATLPIRLYSQVPAQHTCIAWADTHR